MSTCLNLVQYAVRHNNIHVLLLVVVSAFYSALCKFFRGKKPSRTNLYWLFGGIKRAGNLQTLAIQPRCSAVLEITEITPFFLCNTVYATPHLSAPAVW